MAPQTPLLSEGMTEAKRVALASLKQHPGFSVLEEMHMEACKRANEDVIKLDPQDEGYERKLKALQLRARERNEFSLLILRSIDYHTEIFKPVVQDTTPEENQIIRRGTKNPIKDVTL